MAIYIYIHINFTRLSQLIPSCAFVANLKTQLLITIPPILRQLYYISLSHEQWMDQCNSIFSMTSMRAPLTLFIAGGNF